MRGITIDVVEEVFCDLLDDEDVKFLEGKKSASIATLIGSVRPLMFKVAILIWAIYAGYWGGGGESGVAGHTLSFFNCDAVVQFL